MTVAIWTMAAGITLAMQDQTGVSSAGLVLFGAGFALFCKAVK